MAAFVVLLLAIVLFAAGAEPASAATPIHVNETTGDDNACDGTAASGTAPACPVKTMQEGVDLVDAGGEVNVAAGTYAEIVVVNKPLTLKGAKFGVDARTRVVTPGSESIIDGSTPATATVQINANDVIFDGFTVQGGANSPSVGIFPSGVHSGWKVANNIITDNVIGLYPSCASNCTVEKNLFDGNNQCPTCGAGGAGIYTDFATSGLSITQNEFKNHSNNSSIILASAGVTHQSPVITQNHIHSNPGDLNDGPHTAVFLVKTNNATVTANRISQPNGPAISLAGGNTGTTIQNNDLRDSHRGLRIEDVVGVGPNSGATVSNNAFGNNNTFGLSIIGSTAGYSGGPLNAENNWWGKASGPMNVGNPGGTGAVVDGNVTFTSFLVKGVDLEPIAIGFQPDTSPINTVHVVHTGGSDANCNGSVSDSFTASPDQLGACALSSLARAVEIVASGGTVNVGAGTFTGPTAVITKPVSIIGAGMGATTLDGQNTVTHGIASHTNVANLTVTDLKLTNYTQDGVTMDGNSSITDVLFEDVESSANGRHGFYITPNAGQTVNNVTFRRVTASSNDPAPSDPSPGRGIWMINGTKTNITVEDGTFENNRLVGIDLSEGSVANAIITGNHVEGNGDSGIGVLGPTTPMSVKDNEVINNGRFGIEIKNPSGPTSGATALVVEENTVTGPNGAGSDQRDYAGIVVMRRGSADAGVPAGLLVRNNVVTNFKRTAGSPSDGFGIAAEGINIQIRNNVVGGNDVGIQVQSGNPTPCGTPPGCNSTPFFDRGDSPAAFTAGFVVENDIQETNAIGFRAVGAGVTNANVNNNWWGSSSGPSGLGNGAGSSAMVSTGATIDFTPFLGHGTDTLPAIGFQPDLTPQTTVHVMTNGSDTGCDGSQNVAFSAELLGACAVQTIQQGANNVVIPASPNVGTVSIGPGSYNETTITLTDKDRLTIKGAQAANRPHITNGLALADHTDLTLENLIISGIGRTVVGPPPATYVVSFGPNGSGVTNFTMTNVKIDGEGNVVDQAAIDRHGIAGGQFGGTITITHSQFEDINNWVAFDTNSGGSGTNIVNGTFSNNTITRVKGHVCFRAASSPTPAAVIQVTNNTWTQTGDFNNGATANLKVFFAASATITGNMFKDVGVDNGSDPHTNPPPWFATELNFYGAAVIPRKVTNLTIQNNLFENNNQAIAFEPPNPAGLPGNSGELLPGGTISNNTFLNNKFGIYIPTNINPASNLAGLTITENSFVSNVPGAEAIHNGSSASGNLPAIKNWWGNANGPMHATNPGGTGSVVTNKVSFSPWLADGTDTSGAIGFQPNLTPLGFLNTQGINITPPPPANLTTTENGGTAFFTVALASQPTADVQIGISSSNTNEGTIDKALLTFTSANWNVPQTVTVTGVAVGAANGNVPYTIVTAAATSTDPSFNGLNPADVAVTNNAAVIPSIAIADVSQPEGNTGTTPMVFNVTLSQASPRGATVNFATQNQTATGALVGADYASVADGSVAFNPGETSKNITIQITGDTTFEQTETFLVNLSSPVGATIADGQATGTIQADDLDTAAVCNPRPNIVLESVAVGGRQLQVTVKADTTAPNQANVLTQITFDPPKNATIQMLGQPGVGTTPINLPAGTKQIVFLVAQTNANLPFLAEFSVSDSCSATPGNGPVKKFVGAGKDGAAN